MGIAITDLGTAIQGDILVTSRSRDLHRLGDPIQLDPLTDEEGKRLLLRLYKGQNVEQYEDEALAIVRRFGGLALASTGELCSNTYQANSGSIVN